MYGKKNGQFRKPTPQQIARFKAGYRIGKAAYAYLSKQYGANVAAVAQRPRTGNLRGAKSNVAVRTIYDTSNYLSRKNRAPTAIKTGKTGKKKHDYRLSLKSITDMLFPAIRENFREQNAQLDWSSGNQFVTYYDHLSVAKVEEMIKKGRDNNISVTTNLSEANDAENITLHYIGGKQKHTFINNSTNTACMYLYTCTPKRYTRRDPKTTWEEELDKNEPLGANAPTDTNPGTHQFPGQNYPFRKQHQVMAHYFKKLAVKKVVLQPGEQYVHTMYHKPFTIGSKKLSMSLLDEYGNVSTEPLFGYFTNFLMVVSYSQLITDSADNGINYGSGAIGHISQEENLYRATMPNRPYQEINHGTLDTITGTEQQIDPTERELTAYGEA